MILLLKRLQKNYLFGNIFVFVGLSKKKELNMKEIFIIKDCFDSYEEVHKHFLTKATNVNVLSYEEATNLNSSKSTVLIHQKLEEKEGW